MWHSSLEWSFQLLLMVGSFSAINFNKLKEFPGFEPHLGSAPLIPTQGQILLPMKEDGACDVFHYHPVLDCLFNLLFVELSNNSLLWVFLGALELFCHR